MFRGGRIAKLPPALLAMQNGALDPVPVAKHVGGRARVALAQHRCGFAVEETAPLSPDRSDAMGDVEAHPAPEIRQHVGGAGPSLAKAEIRADDHVAYAEPVGEHVASEGFGRWRLDKVVSKRKLCQDLDAEFLQTMGARLGVHQAEGRRVGGEELARMRLERPPRPRGASGRRARSITWAWPRWHAIEIADRHGGGPRSSGRVNW